MLTAYYQLYFTVYCLLLYSINMVYYGMETKGQFFQVTHFQYYCSVVLFSLPIQGRILGGCRDGLANILNSPRNICPLQFSLYVPLSSLPPPLPALLSHLPPSLLPPTLYHPFISHHHFKLSAPQQYQINYNEVY